MDTKTGRSFFLPSRLSMEDHVGHLGKVIRSGVPRRWRVSVAKAKSWWKGHKLPPGNFFRLEPLLASDPKALALKALETGPIFTSIWDHKLVICVTSLPVARRLLQKHRDDIKAVSIDITSVVPKGMLRTMEGIDHKTYRRHFSRAISGEVFASQISEARSIVSEALGRVDGDGRPNWSICAQIALRLLLRTFLGVAPQSSAHRELEEQFNAMAPNGFAWTVGPQQKAAFEIIRSLVVAMVSSSKEDKGAIPDSVLSRLIQEGATDLTTIGNLIYMIEMGRFDLAFFFFRIVKFLGEDWSMFRRIVSSEKSDRGITPAQAVLLEVLRLEQTQRLMRSARRDFIFDDFLFPKGAVIRICLWEAHQNADVFENPSAFDADRHLNTTFSVDQFSPFGLGHHHCPAADTTMQLGSMFVEIYAAWRLAAV